MHFRVVYTGQDYGPHGMCSRLENTTVKYIRGQKEMFVPASSATCTIANTHNSTQLHILHIEPYVLHKHHSNAHVQAHTHTCTHTQARTFMHIHTHMHTLIT